MSDEGARTLANRARRLETIARDVRLNILDMIHTANSGHPGGSLSAADIMTALHFDIMRTDPSNPRWPLRDRVLLSKGHACPVLYACLAMRGYFDMSHLKTLRQFESILQGHPIQKTPGVDMTTGSLGHGLSIGLGMALEARLTGHDYSVYVILGDGELNEGLVWEAAMGANKFAVNNLVAIVDRNGLQMDGPCEDVMPMGDIAAKFSAFGWTTREINGHSMPEVLEALEWARDHASGPVALVASTVKGKGVSYMENKCEWHGRCPSQDQFCKAIEDIKEA